jgi:hypothetical protein
MREGEEAILAAALHWAEVDSECRKYSEYTTSTSKKMTVFGMPLSKRVQD